jgi:hypothetical protein
MKVFPKLSFMFVFVIVCALLFMLTGCSSTRTATVMVPVQVVGVADQSTSETAVTASYSDVGSTAWSVGALSLTASGSRSADGATTGTATLTVTKHSMSSMWSAGLGAAAGIIAAVGAAGM